MEASREPFKLKGKRLKSAAIADQLDDAGFHDLRLDAAMDGARDDFIEETVHQVLVEHETPQVQLQVVTVYLKTINI